MLQPIARPLPVYFVGDSLTTVFADRVYERAGDPRRYLARTKYVNGITAAGLAGEDGALHPGVLTALLGDCVIVEEDGALRALHRAESRHWRYAAATMGRPRSSPVVVLMAGSLDIAQTLEEIGPDADFEVPPAFRAHPAPARGPRRIVDAAGVLERIERRAQGLERGLRALRALGLDELFVHSLAPTNADDEAFAKVFGVPCPAELRYKVGLVLNERLRAACERAGVPFLDLWPQTTEGPWLRREHVLDGAHFNDRAALLTMARVLETVRPG
jgi:hypothetical protein